MPRSSRTAIASPTIDRRDLGRIAYREAYQIQRACHEQVLAAREEGADWVGRVHVLEHDPPVITVSKRPGVRTHLIATESQLAEQGVTVEETDRGGDITYHGPGQLVAYPILDLNRLGMGLHDYMRCLEEAVIRTCADFGVEGRRDEKATGVWVDREGVPGGAKVCALGVRVRKWITMHGLALNVSSNLDHFSLIVPCGLAGRPVTSLGVETGAAPSMDRVKSALVAHLAQLLGAAIDDSR